jgi:polyhydroxyalkanoate synthesis regulator phasin
MPDSIDMIVPLLREMRKETSSGFAAVETRLDKLEATLGSFRNALTADSLLSKLVTGEFESRIEALERKVRELESHK